MFCNIFNFSAFWKHEDEQWSIFGVFSMSLEALEVDLGVPRPKNVIKQSGKSNEYVTAKYGKLSNLEPAKNGKLCVGSKLGAKIKVGAKPGSNNVF